MRIFRPAAESLRADETIPRFARILANRATFLKQNQFGNGDSQKEKELDLGEAFFHVLQGEHGKVAHYVGAIVLEVDCMPKPFVTAITKLQ